MEIRLLGPLEVVRGQTPIAIDAPRHRAVLADLAVRDGAPVTASELIAAVWGDDPPATADKTLQGYVSALRKTLGEGAIETIAGGYRLGPAVDLIDAAELDDRVGAGRTDLEHGQPAAARRSFVAALGLWRGQPLGDLASGPARDGQIARLEELRLLAAEGLHQAELELGHHRELVPDLERLVAEHPYREAFWRSLMLALYRSGRAADALAAYRRLRSRLIEDLGLEPSAETRRLEDAILRQDEHLDPPPSTPPGNLRAPLDSFVDRVEERRSVVELLGHHRLVTLTGIGGVGKSRLANEVARAVLGGVPGGSWWIDLATIPGDGSVLATTMGALELAVPSTGTAEQILLTRLRRAPTLLVLDNCEHVRRSAAAFVEWVTAADAGVRVLATSRVPLEVPGEHRVRIAPLSVAPNAGSSLSDAGRLFADRVAARAAVGPVDLVDVDTIGELVGGLPLGIELAAAQCGARTPAEVAEALRDPRSLLRLTAADAGSRHASLGHVLDASIDALAPSVAALLPRLAVLPGDFDLAAAAAVLGTSVGDATPTISALLDASLLATVPGALRSRRFRLLRPVREHLDLRLDADDRAAAEAAQAGHFRSISRRFVDIVDTAVEHVWLDQASIDDHNLRLALAWFEEHDPVGALDFGPGLGEAWQIRGDQDEGRDTLRRLLRSAPDAPGSLVAWTESALCWPEFLSGEVDAAIGHVDDAIDRFERLGDPRGLSRTLRSRAHAFHLAGVAADVTTPIYQRSIAVAEAAGLEYSVALSQVHFGHALGACEVHDVVDVDAMLESADAVLRRHGDHTNLAHSALGRVFTAFGRRDDTALRAAADEMVRQATLARTPTWMQVGMIVLGLAAHELGDDAERRRCHLEAVGIAHDTANRAQLGIALHAVAATSAARHPREAARLWGAAGSMTPIWPLHARRYGEWMEAARRAIGEGYDLLVADGATCTPDEAVALARSIL